jgi:hypothetical protein
MLDSAPERSRSTGVLGRDIDVGLLLSVLDGGLSYRDAIGFAGDAVWLRMIGIDRFSFSSCALVVVGSLRKAFTDDFCANSRLRGVEGGIDCVEHGVVGVGILVMDECDEWPPILDCDLLFLAGIGPPLSETGAREEGTLSCPPSGLGRRDPAGAAGLFVNTSATAVLGR